MRAIKFETKTGNTKLDNLLVFRKELPGPGNKTRLSYQAFSPWPKVNCAVSMRGDNRVHFGNIETGEIHYFVALKNKILSLIQSSNFENNRQIIAIVEPTNPEDGFDMVLLFLSPTNMSVAKKDMSKVMFPSEYVQEWTKSKLEFHTLITSCFRGAGLVNEGDWNNRYIGFDSSGAETGHSTLRTASVFTDQTTGVGGVVEFKSIKTSSRDRVIAGNSVKGVSSTYAVTQREMLNFDYTVRVKSGGLNQAVAFDNQIYFHEYSSKYNSKSGYRLSFYLDKEEGGEVRDFAFTGKKLYLATDKFLHVYNDWDIKFAESRLSFLEEVKNRDPIKTFEGKSRFIKKKLPKPDMTLCSFGESRLLNVDVKKSGDRAIIFAEMGKPSGEVFIMLLDEDFRPITFIASEGRKRMDFEFFSLLSSTEETRDVVHVNDTIAGITQTVELNYMHELRNSMRLINNRSGLTTPVQTTTNRRLQLD